MTAIQKFMNTDVDMLTPLEIVDLATHILLDEMPCEFCSSWVPRHYEFDYYQIGGIEICVHCEENFQVARRKSPLDRRLPLGRDDG